MPCSPASPPSTSAPVTILMGVRNGAAYLQPQLDSIAAQTQGNWHLQCSDDGSTDMSPLLIESFADLNPNKVRQISGPQTGFSDNYMQMIRALPETVGFVSFADQDDVWMPDKLARGLTALDGLGQTPALYCSRRWIWFPEHDRRFASSQVRRPCNFRNALIENVAGGNTIILNPAAARIARAAAQMTGSVFAHDWWLYLLITGVGGKVKFDAGTPTLLYRQHQANAIGAGHGFLSQLQRKAQVMQGAFAKRISSNLEALDRVAALLTPENQAIISQFSQARRAPLIPRLRTFSRSGTYRQSWQGNLGFWGAASLGQV